MIADQGAPEDENTRQQYCTMPFTLASGAVTLGSADPIAKCEFTTISQSDVVMNETDLSVVMTYTDSKTYTKDESLTQAEAMDALLKNVELYVTATGTTATDTYAEEDSIDM